MAPRAVDRGALRVHQLVDFRCRPAHSSDLSRLPAALDRTRTGGVHPLSTWDGRVGDRRMACPRSGSCARGRRCSADRIGCRLHGMPRIVVANRTGARLGGAESARWMAAVRVCGLGLAVCGSCARSRRDRHNVIDGRRRIDSGRRLRASCDGVRIHRTDDAGRCQPRGAEFHRKAFVESEGTRRSVSSP